MIIILGRFFSSVGDSSSLVLWILVFIIINGCLKIVVLISSGMFLGKLNVVMLLNCMLVSLVVILCVVKDSWWVLSSVLIVLFMLSCCEFRLIIVVYFLVLLCL